MPSHNWQRVFFKEKKKKVHKQQKLAFLVQKLQYTLSTVVFCRQTIFAQPMSPLVENLIPSFVTDITANSKDISSVLQWSEWREEIIANILWKQPFYNIIVNIPYKQQDASETFKE